MVPSNIKSPRATETETIFRRFHYFVNKNWTGTDGSVTTSSISCGNEFALLFCRVVQYHTPFMVWYGTPKLWCELF